MKIKWESVGETFVIVVVVITSIVFGYTFLHMSSQDRDDAIYYIWTAPQE